MKPLLVAHRGDTVNHLENTIEAFTAAFKRGADGIELDVQLHNDTLIVVHNYLFDKSKKYPELAEVLRLFAKKGKLELEVKSLDLDFLPKFKNLIDQYKEADLEITTSVWPIVHYLRQALPTSRLGIIFPLKEFEDWMTEEFVCTKVIKLMRLMDGNDVHLPWVVIKAYPPIVKVCHDNNFRVHSHIYKHAPEDENSIYNEMSNLEIDQCTFDGILLLDGLQDS